MAGTGGRGLAVARVGRRGLAVVRAGGRGLTVGETCSWLRQEGGTQLRK